MYKPLTVQITKEMIEKAKARDHGAYNSSSFMNGGGNMVGFIGEYMVGDSFPKLKHVDEFNHDFEYNGKKIEIKTKHQNVPRTPADYYEASITMCSLHQDVDYYIFCRVYKDCDQYLNGWILGGISKEDLLKKGRKLKKGTQDGNNGYVVRADCINIRYDQLKPLIKD